MVDAQGNSGTFVQLALAGDAFDLPDAFLFLRNPLGHGERVSFEPDCAVKDDTPAVNHLESWLSRAVERCQEADKTFPRITAHDLRHTAASLGDLGGYQREGDFPDARARLSGHDA